MATQAARIEAPIARRVSSALDELVYTRTEYPHKQLAALETDRLCDHGQRIQMNTLASPKPVQ